MTGVIPSVELGGLFLTRENFVAHIFPDVAQYFRRAHETLIPYKRVDFFYDDLMYR